MNKTLVFIGLVIVSSMTSFLFMDTKAEAFSDLYAECRGLYNATGNPWGENGVVQELGITPAAGETEYIRGANGDVSLRLAINVGFCKDHSIRDPAVPWPGCDRQGMSCYDTPSGQYYGTYYPKTTENYYALYGGLRTKGVIMPIALSVPSVNGANPYQVVEPWKKQGDRNQASGPYVDATINVPVSIDLSEPLEFCLRSGDSRSRNYYPPNQQLSYSFFQDNDYMCTPMSITSYNYNLVPLIDLDVAGVAEVDSSLTATAKLRNDGPSKTKAGTEWQFVKMVVGPGKSLPVAGTSSNVTSPCTYYGNGCGLISASSGTFKSKTTTTLSSKTESVSDIAVGSRICYATSVKPYNHTTSNWRHSTPACVTIGKKPKVQVWGGDLSVGRRFSGDTSKPKSIVKAGTSMKDGGSKTFGSWVEYGIFAPSTIAGVGSAAGLAGPDGNLLSAQKDWSKLTFANGGQLNKTADCSGTVQFGCFANPGDMGVIPDVVGRLAPGTAGTPLGGSVSLTNLGAGTYYANGSLRINASAIAKGKSLIIKARDTVFIDGDIKYTTEQLHSLSDIPQVVIIANNIQIKDTVTNVDAWLIANGAQGGVYTCNNNNFVQPLTASTCKDKLTINGPVMAKKLFLTRTAGSGTGAASGDPAEVLNLRADAHLWAINRAGGQGSVRTLGTTELAPRF